MHRTRHPARNPARRPSGSGTRSPSLVSQLIQQHAVGSGHTQNATINMEESDWVPLIQQLRDEPQAADLAADENQKNTELVDGRLESINIFPTDSRLSLVVDHLRDVGPNLDSDVDLGPLRFYTRDEGLKVRTSNSRLMPPRFECDSDTINFSLEHLHLPLPEAHAGYYILLLPSDFAGKIRTSPRVDNLIRALQHRFESATPFAFVCHSSDDKKEARRLAVNLATRGIRPWVDEAEIKIGDSLIEKIQDGIDGATCLLPLLSEASVSSRWCREELRMALAQQIAGYGTRVLPIMLSECKIPGFLLDRVYLDLSEHAGYDDQVDSLARRIHDLANAG